MRPFSRRHLLRSVWAWSILTAGTDGLISRVVAAEVSPAPRVIEIVAQRFKFTPSDIELKVGERIVLAITSLDFVHGMNMPDFGKRADLMPGKITHIELQPLSPGTFVFVCDNFCGDGHEEMHGRFIVST